MNDMVLVLGIYGSVYLFYDNGKNFIWFNLFMGIEVL